jgi:pimeloyl-ACP methyl ester carboxylesterase
VPTLLLFGAHDKVVPPENADLMADLIPGSQIAIIPDAGHFFSIETPESASHIIIDLLKQEV